MLSVPGKVFAHVILARIRPTLLSYRRPQQSGFTPGRSTCDRIVTLSNVTQRRQDYGHSTFAVYVDLRAAFDSLSRPLVSPGKDRYPRQVSQFDQSSLR